MSEARRFNRWMADTLAPFLQGSVLEIGAGIGNLTELLCAHSTAYCATDSNEAYIHELRTKLHSFGNVKVATCDLTDRLSCRPFTGLFNTVICLNVLEHVPDDQAAMANILSTLRPHGRAVLLVPQGRFAFGSLDRVLEHQRRYSRAELSCKMRAAGFMLDSVFAFNRITYPGWILNGRLLRHTTFSATQLGWFDRLVPIWRRIDRYLPWPPTSLIAVGTRRS